MRLLTLTIIFTLLIACVHSQRVNYVSSEQAMADVNQWLTLVAGIHPAKNIQQWAITEKKEYKTISINIQVFQLMNYHYFINNVPIADIFQEYVSKVSGDNLRAKQITVGGNLPAYVSITWPKVETFKVIINGDEIQIAARSLNSCS